jgi:hypothetical protein
MRCPDCLPAREARELLLEHEPLRTALLALLPFVITLAIAALVVRLIGSHD